MEQLHDMRAQFERALRNLTIIEGRRQALCEREQQLVREIGEAKGRLALKGKIDQFLEDLQSRAHARTVGKYETLLTALLHDILPDEHPLGLNLYNERGLPALDVNLVRPDGLTEDVLEDNGGAMTNVVSMGLRMIAAVKARKRSFLALDEADCWIQPERVPSFYRVLREAADKLSVQCLVISHHSVETLDSQMSIARIHAEGGESIGVESDPNLPVWEADQKGMRFIRLHNIQGYQDETLHLSPGVNAVVGDNNLGKSTWVRALRAVFYGECRDSLIRHGEKRGTVTVGLENGLSLEWSRQPRRNPVNVWRLLDAQGEVVERDGIYCETGGRTVPEWVEKLCGIGKVEDLDVHIAHQKKPIFLLAESASKRATVLSIGQESGYIQKMILLHKENVNRDNATIRRGEKELSEVRERITRMEAIPTLTSDLKSAERKLLEIERNSSLNNRMEATLEKIDEISAALVRERQREAVLAQLPSPEDLQALDQALRRGEDMEAALARLQHMTSEVQRHRRMLTALAALPTEVPALQEVGTLERSLSRIVELQRALTLERQRAEALVSLPDEMPVLISNDEMIIAGRRIRDLQGQIEEQRQLDVVLRGLPEQPPELVETTSIEETVRRIQALQEAREAEAQAQHRIEAEMLECERRIVAAVDDMGGLCPTCGGDIKDPLALLDHQHRQPARV